MSSEMMLKPCPFCGGAARAVDGKDEFEHSRAGISCTACPAEMTYSPDAFPYASDAEDLREFKRHVEAWNRRAAPAPPAPAGELVRDDTGRVTSDYDPTALEIEICRNAICREFGNNGTDGYYIRILKAIHAVKSPTPDADAIRRAALEDAAKEIEAVAQSDYDGCEKARGPCSETGAYECDLERNGRDCLCMHGFDVAESAAAAIRALATRPAPGGRG